MAQNRGKMVVLLLAGLVVFAMLWLGAILLVRSRAHQTEAAGEVTLQRSFRSSGTNPTAAALRQVKISDIGWDTDGVLTGRARNMSSQRVTGNIVLHIVVKSDAGFRTADRDLHATVNWPPQTESAFRIPTKLESPEPKSKTRVELVAVP